MNAIAQKQPNKTPWLNMFLFLKRRNPYIIGLEHGALKSNPVNREKYPTVLHSLFNMVPVYQDGTLAKCRKHEWYAKAEAFLSKPNHRMLAAFVTGDFETCRRLYNKVAK